MSYRKTQMVYNIRVIGVPERRQGTKIFEEIVASYFIVLMTILYLIIPYCWHLGYFQFYTIRNNILMNTLVHKSSCVFQFPWDKCLRVCMLVQRI